MTGKNYLSVITGGLQGGGEPPDNGSMDARLAAVEDAVSRIDVTLPNLATKADIKDAVSSTERWMIATVVGLFIGFGGLFMAMSNALKPSTTPPTPPQSQPIIINVPAPTPVPAPEEPKAPKK